MAPLVVVVAPGELGAMNCELPPHPPNKFQVVPSNQKLASVTAFTPAATVQGLAKLPGQVSVLDPTPSWTILTWITRPITALATLAVQFPVKSVLKMVDAPVSQATVLEQVCCACAAFSGCSGSATETSDMSIWLMNEPFS